MLPKVFAASAAGVDTAPLVHRKSSKSLFTADFPFPCLLNPEPDENEPCKTNDVTPASDQDEDDVFEWLDEDVGTLRVASNTTRYAGAGSDGITLVSTAGQLGLRGGSIVCGMRPSGLATTKVGFLFQKSDMA